MSKKSRGTFANHLWKYSDKIIISIALTTLAAGIAASETQARGVGVGGLVFAYAFIAIVFAMYDYVKGKKTGRETGFEIGKHLIVGLIATLAVIFKIACLFWLIRGWD